MAKTFQLNVVDTHKEIFQGEITKVMAPGTMGGLTVMAGHTPLITSLNPGELIYSTPEGETEYLFISGGILEVQPTLVTILADTILRTDELDAKAAQESIDRANQKIKNTKLDSKLHADLEREIQIMRTLIELSKTTNKVRIRRH